MLNEQPDTWKDMGEALVDLTGIEAADGIDGDASRWVSELSDEYSRHSAHNRTLRDYYDGRVKVSDYGVTADIENDQSCHWPQKAVDALADRTRLLSITSTDEAAASDIDAIERRNGIVSGYNRHLPVKFIYGCMAATVTKDGGGHARVRWHSAETFTALPSPDFDDGVVAGGLAIARRERTTWSAGRMVPTVVNLHTPGNIGEFRQVDSGHWTYEPGPVPEELPMLFVFSHNGKGTLAPFGQTRITKFVRTLTDDAIRCLWHMQVSGAFYSMAKLYMTGLTDEQFDSVMSKKSAYQLSRLLAMTMGPEGQSPNIGQLSGNSPQPFIDELRALACQFSGATGVPLNSLGIVQDNPSSAEAIGAAREDICLVAERGIEDDKRTLARVLRAALAVERNTTTGNLEGVDVLARFASPMINSLAARTDSAMKVASIDGGFAGSDEFYEMVGFDEATVEKLAADRRRAEAVSAVDALMQANPRALEGGNAG